MIIIQSEIHPNQLTIRFTTSEQQNSLYNNTVTQLKTLYPDTKEEGTDVTVDNIINIGKE
jgi:hypothetical protein